MLTCKSDTTWTCSFQTQGLMFHLQIYIILIKIIWKQKYFNTSSFKNALDILSTLAPKWTMNQIVNAF